MDIVTKMRSPGEDEIKDLFESAIKLLKRTIELYQLPHLALSFNAGKDSCVLLHLLRAAIADIYKEESTLGSLHGMPCFMVLQDDEFQEIIEFSQEMDQKYALNLHFLKGPMKSSLETFSQNHDIKGVILGTRRGDPNSPGQGLFCPTTESWPPLMRINPIIDWTYQNVWSFLRKAKVPYCKLYDLGYTSIGEVRNTTPNSALRKENGTFAPAYMLSDSRLERIGRQSSLQRIQSTGSTLTKKAGLMIIGDELLSGKVEDVNVAFLCRELRSLGWRLNKVVFVPDEVDSIASELTILSASHEMVLTAGGVGPTVDDVTMQGVAKAMQTTLSRHPYLEKLIRDFFKEHVTQAHLKMTEIPQDEIEFIDTYDIEGKITPFPLVKCRNVYILPGVPRYLRITWKALKSKLEKKECLPPFYNVVLRLIIENETEIAPALESVAKQMGPQVQIGSYPVTGEKDGANLFILIESKVKEELDQAKELFCKQFSADIILSAHEGVKKLRHSRMSLQDIIESLQQNCSINDNCSSE